ncbi:phosphatidylserine decarboxylase [Micromonospora sp. LOL_021]|uniref:phosphatidylserine decarboxylase n=1 Tax=Micromonospora sp. LOL_021 TaxID=3345417 RepID=UPI003A8921C5
MSDTPVPATSVLRTRVDIGERAARALTAELARDNAAKHVLLVEVAPGSVVVDAAIDALLPGDTMTVVPASADQTAQLRTEIAGHGPWVDERVRVIETASAADPADLLIVGTVRTGSGEQTRAMIDGYGKYLTEGAVLSVAVAALPGGTSGAAAELDRQAALFGVGSDLVLRNVPPLRVHRLRFTPAPVDRAAKLGPAFRTSSVPLTRGMHIDSSGVAAAGIALGLAAATRLARPKSRLWLLPALAAGPVAAFFRDPQRDVPEDPTAVVAASDGRVLSVERVHDERLDATEFLRIAVFLSVLDVHVNRSPVAGRVVDHFVTDGGFAAAMKPAAEHNVAAYTVLETSRGRVVVAQRTGMVARRIVHRAPVGGLLAKGERFGLIRFGSRTDVYLPADAAEALVGPGDRVAGGSSVIARWR